jgi:hypothetical protein
VPDPDKPIEGDPYTPNVARMYDYLLGGKDNFAADRDAVEKIVAIMPHAPRWVRDNPRHEVERCSICRAVGRGQS